MPKIKLAWPGEQPLRAGLNTFKKANSPRPATMQGKTPIREKS